VSLQNSDSARHPLHGSAINLALLTAFVLLIVGLLAPILTLEKFYVFSNTISLWSALVQLAKLHEWGLFLLIGGFSVVFPILKILLLLAIWNWEAATTERHQQHLKWLSAYSKWSMLDVFVVALLVVSVKLGALAEAHVEYGIYAFATSVIITMLVSARIGNMPYRKPISS
jgi:paraquat-inducible protein A